MINILARLTAIKQYAKDIHYTASGETFYTIHLLMDRVSDGLDDFKDGINETCFMGAGKVPPLSTDVLKLATALIPDVTETYENINKLLSLVVDTIEMIEQMTELDKADDNLLSSIAENLKLKSGLLARQVVK